MSALTDSFADWPAAGKAPDTLQVLQRLGLERQAAELDAYGFTFLEPERAAPAGFADALREAVLDVAKRRSGVRPDPSRGVSHGERDAWGQHIFYLLLEGEIFEQAMMNENVLALITHLLGESCLLSSMNSIIKGPGNEDLVLHADMAMAPAPFPAYAQVANATWTLSDYDRAAGALTFWPGSHKFCRPPTREEVNDKKRFMPVVAPAGSLIVWHGNTWHGAFARTAPGLRVNLIMYFCRIYIQTQEWYRTKITPEALARNDERFAHLVGLTSPYPFDERGAPIEKIARFNSAAKTQAG